MLDFLMRGKNNAIFCLKKLTMGTDINSSARFSLHQLFEKIHDVRKIFLCKCYFQLNILQLFL